jgi:hypothetical protein
MRKNLSLVFAAALAASAQEKPTAEQILDRFVQVTGGQEAYAKVRSEVTSETVELKAQGIKGKLATYRLASGESYMAMEIEGAGKIEQGITGGVSWENSAMTGPRVRTGEEKSISIRAALIDRDSQWRNHFSKTEFTGEETVEGVVCYKLVLTPKEGSRTETRFYEKESGLLKRTTMVMPTQMGDLPITVTLSGYKDFGGFKRPSLNVTSMAGTEIVMTTSAVEYNTEIPADRFAIPAAVKALIEKPAAAPKQ